MTVPKEVTNNGVALLLERMETHPEEFVLGHKWGRIIQEMHKYASKGDSEALNTKLKGIMLQSLTEQILEELVDPKSSPTQYTSAMPLGGQIQALSSAQQQAIQLQAAQAQHQAHINAHQQALGALGVNSATQSIGYGAGATNLLKNIFGGNK